MSLRKHWPCKGIRRFETLGDIMSYVQPTNRFFVNRVINMILKPALMYFIKEQS